MDEGTIDFESKDLTAVDIGSLRLSGMSCKVTELNFNYNRLSSLPYDLAEAVPKLKILCLCGNDLTEVPCCVGSLQDLRILLLNENEISRLTPSLFQLPNLTELHLLGNRLTHIHDDFYLLRNLRNLTLEDNQLNRLPETFGKLQNLRVLEACENNLEFLPKNFGLLVNLSVLNLSRNKLLELPDSFGDLPSLQYLDISNNELSALTPRLLSASRCLIKLYVSDNILKRFPLWIGELAHIEEFSFGNNYIEDKLPDDFGTVSGRTLRHMDIGANHVDCLPPTMGELTKVETLHFGSHILELERAAFQNGNRIIELPDSFAHMRNLRHLRLDENQLARLPDNFGDLKSLEFIDIGQNIVAELPASFCELASLKTCFLSRNRITRLPDEIGKLQSLETLRLNTNLLTNLPASFPQLTSLRTLDLIDNRFTEFPVLLNELPNLHEVAIYENNFDYGEYPDVARLYNPAVYPKDGIHKFVRTTVSDGQEKNGVTTSALARALKKGSTVFKSHVVASDENRGISAVSIIDAEQGSIEDGDDHLDDVLSDGDEYHLAPSPEVEYMNHNEQEAENWDMEIDDDDPFSCDTPITYRHTPSRRSPQGKDVIDFLFIPSDDHPPSLPVHSLDLNCEDGQFDDAD